MSQRRVLRRTRCRSASAGVAAPIRRPQEVPSLTWTCQVAIARLLLHTLQSLRWALIGGAWRSGLRLGQTLTSRAAGAAPFIFTYKVRNVSWQVTCPCYRKNKTTVCRETTKGGPSFRAIQFSDTGRQPTHQEGQGDARRASSSSTESHAQVGR